VDRLDSYILDLKRVNMRSIDSHYLNSWIQAASLVLDQEPPVHLLLEEASEPVIINLEGRRNPDLGLLANRLVRIYGDDVGQPVYGPQLLWLREWGIWDDNNESIASEEFAALLRGFGQTSGTRGLLFEQEESGPAVIFALFMMNLPLGNNAKKMRSKSMLMRYRQYLGLSGEGLRSEPVWRLAVSLWQVVL